MSVNGDQKGKRYMRDICRYLHSWVVGTEPRKQEDLAFRVRSTALLPTDGHWKGKGDILCRPDIPFCFAIECKKHERWELDGMMANEKWPVWDWWEQSCRQANESGLLPLLIFTRNRREDYALVTEEVAKCLLLKPSANGPQLTVDHAVHGKLRLVLLRGLIRSDVKKAHLKLAAMLTKSQR